MFEIVNGILHKDGKPVFCIGQSYYPSFFHNKYPVPPEGDRMGEMKKDLVDMAEFGFNHVRFAALGDVEAAEDGSVSVKTPFIDEMIREAQWDGMSVSVRLQGYAMNLHGYQNVRMIDETGREQDPKRWADFIQTNLQHPGMRADNADSTRALARHFGAQPGVVAFQIYNEPHFPGPGIFDYHPEAIRAYRRYLADRGVMTEEEAQKVQPPRSRREKTPEDWASWRDFGRESITEFLAESAAAAKEGCDLPAYTCLTTCQVHPGAPFRGVDVLGNARWADLIGYTCYFSAAGADYYSLCLFLDLNVSAAKLRGKHAWCIEQDARTTIPPLTFNRDVYAALGAGVKGLLFYQWRGDAPSPDTPEPNGFGLINCDRTHTANYDNAHACVRFLQEMSEKLVAARPHDDGIAVLFSNHAIALADGRENIDENFANVLTNSALADLNRVYTDLRKAGLSVTLTGAAELPLCKAKILFVPRRGFISPEEREAVEVFRENGGKVYELAVKRRGSIGKGTRGYALYGAEEGVYRELMQIEDLVELEGLVPAAVSDHYAAPVQLLDGDGYHLAVVTNIAKPERPICPTLTVNFPAVRATVKSSLREEITLPVVNGRIPLGEVPDGCVVVIE